MSDKVKNKLSILAQSNITNAHKVVVLAEQGYVVNTRKLEKLNLGVILYNIYKSGALGYKDFASNVERLTNKFVIV